MARRSPRDHGCVTALLGGGMGEVYRATDPKLKREMAIKVRPASVAQAAEPAVS